MNNLIWTLSKIALPLKFNWSMARASFNFKESYIVSVREEDFEGRGEVSVTSRYGESHEGVQREFTEFAKKIIFNSEDTLDAFHEKLMSLNICNALRCGIEMAFLNLLCKKNNLRLNNILNVELSPSYKTSFSIPIMENCAVHSFISNHNLNRFYALKVKINKECGKDLLMNVAKEFSGKIRIDANESFESSKDFLLFLHSIKPIHERIEFIEQPLGAHLHSYMKEIKAESPFIYIADEAVDSYDYQDFIYEEYDGINVKILKSGGVINSLKLLNKARSNQLKTMLGCMIETSLGISTALHISSNVDYLDLDGHLLLADDPYNLIKEENGDLYIK